MRFTLPVLALFAAAVMAHPTSSDAPPSKAELTSLAERVAAGEVPEGVSIVEKRSAAEEAAETLAKRATYCGAKSNGTCCCAICSSGRGEYQ